LTPLPTTSNPERDRADDINLHEAVGKWLVSLRPRERQVLSYRFGLGGSPRLSLSQIGKLLEVSKERVRQIQDAALKMLRKDALRDQLIQSY
jgi:RNA polymerase primary sigma factor